MVLAIVLIIFLTLEGCSATHQPSAIPDEVKIDYAAAARINAQLAIVYAQRGMLDRSKEKLLKAQSQDADIPEVYYAQGLYYQNLGMGNFAEKAYQQALNMAPNDYQAYNLYARFLCDMKKDFVKANKLFQQSIVLKKNDNLEETFTLYGRCLLKQSKIVQAKEAFYHAIKQGDDNSAAYWELANIEYHEGNYKEAKKLVDRFIQMAGKTKESLSLKMKILQKLGEGNKAATIRLQLSSNLYNT